jgi:hypothetical protein
MLLQLDHTCLPSAHEPTIVRLDARLSEQFAFGHVYLSMAYVVH